MTRIALEFVPPDTAHGKERAIEDANKVRDLSHEHGIGDRIDTLMIPGMIAEDDDRPVAMRPKMDPLDVWTAAAPELPGIRGLCTQVTAFLDAPALSQRFGDLLGAGIEGIIFVGVPRTMADGEGDGVAPTDALAQFQQQVPQRGVILIPTRDAEDGRFNFKCEQGANFALTQLLYSDYIVRFLRDFAEKHPHRPEVLLSFGFVPKMERRLNLIQWLIQDHGNPLVDEERAFVARLGETKLKEKKRLLLDLYKRVVDGVQDLGFPISLHLEAPYGFTRPAFETFAEMLDYWAPENPQGRKAVEG